MVTLPEPPLTGSAIVVTTFELASVMVMPPSNRDAAIGVVERYANIVAKQRGRAVESNLIRCRGSRGLPGGFLTLFKMEAWRWLPPHPTARKSGIGSV